MKENIINLEEERQRYHYTNQINLPTYLFVSKEYNINVAPVTISGVETYYGKLFQILSECNSVIDACDKFSKMMENIFHLDLKVRGKKNGNYLRLLKGWLFNAGSAEGAVMKGWVESRFGLVPIFHNQIIANTNCEAYYEYMVEKMSARHNKNLIFHQLDLLYTYTQTIIKSFYPEIIPHITLYRGINDLNEHRVVERYNKRELCIEQNSLVSFTSDRDIASQFGDYILESKIPYTKVVFFSDVLPSFSFAGENEYLVLGGRYDTKIHYY